jgi:hypothetical protein
MREVIERKDRILFNRQWPTWLIRLNNSRESARWWRQCVIRQRPNVLWEWGIVQWQDAKVIRGQSVGVRPAYVRMTAVGCGDGIDIHTIWPELADGIRAGHVVGPVEEWYQATHVQRGSGANPR